MLTIHSAIQPATLDASPHIWTTHSNNRVSINGGSAKSISELLIHPADYNIDLTAQQSTTVRFTTQVLAENSPIILTVTFGFTQGALHYNVVVTGQGAGQIQPAQTNGVIGGTLQQPRARQFTVDGAPPVAWDRLLYFQWNGADMHVGIAV